MCGKILCNSTSSLRDVNEDELKELTDDEFLGYLRATDGRLTLDVMIEIERRGSHFLDAEPELRDRWDAMMQNLAAGLKQFGESMAKVQTQIAATVAGTTSALVAMAERVSASLATRRVL